LYVDPDGTIHLSWVWRETWMVETNHDICYARSRDFGVTWERSDSSLYTLPITASNTEYAVRIPQKSELINQTSMTADAEGHPYIATYWRSEGDSVPQYRMVWHDGSQWHHTTVGRRTTPFTLAGGGTKMIPISRPRMVSDGHSVWYFYRDAESGSKVMMAQSTLGSDDWKVTALTDFAVHAWEPSLDAELWKTKGELHLFVQPAFQGDGEHTVDAAPQPVYVLEVRQ
ncbi:MAG: BNR repeat-containing protein, partial [Muribaculaceae bacterium]|nr:BNR repeat-containing protein [Muribaculaceae bacterium]